MLFFIIIVDGVIFSSFVRYFGLNLFIGKWKLVNCWVLVRCLIWLWFFINWYFWIIVVWLMFFDGLKWFLMILNIVLKLGRVNMFIIMLCILGVMMKWLLVVVRWLIRVWQNLFLFCLQKLIEVYSLVRCLFGSRCLRKVISLVGIGMLIMKYEWVKEKMIEIFVLLVIIVLNWMLWFLWCSSGNISGYCLFGVNRWFIRQVFLL